MDSPMVTIGSLGFVVFTLIAAIMNYNLKNQELTVTDKRVYGTLSRKEIELPLDKISYVEAKGESGMTIATAAGLITCQCCTNRDDVIKVISSLLKERNTDSQQNIVNTAPTTSSAIEDIRKYKELLDENVITQEEFEAKKKELLGL
ncbi:MAG: SHOCT domain-containing protein [Clostridia bacterium]|nr:SHOCT domain-containing protein [Clostridia bacterium]